MKWLMFFLILMPVASANEAFSKDRDELRMECQKYASLNKPLCEASKGIEYLASWQYFVHTLILISVFAVYQKVRGGKNRTR